MRVHLWLNILYISNHNLRRESFMDWTLVCDLRESRTLLFGEWTRETHVALDPMNEAVVASHTLRAVL